MAESFRSPRKIARRLSHLPSAIKAIRNWPLFIACYALGLVPRNAYRLRNGAEVMIARAVDHAVFVEVLFNQEYGTPIREKTIVDIGASTGVFSVCAAATARHARIYAYEPASSYYAVLIDNIERNRATSRIKAFNAAVASDNRGRKLVIDGERFFFPSIIEGNDGASPSAVQVASITLPEIFDSNAIERVDLLKMDCEGAEYEVLYATPPEYLQRIARLRMEYHNLDSATQHIDALSAFLVENGFRIVRSWQTGRHNGVLWAERDAVS
jgi:FkbM family methyltransferase